MANLDTSTSQLKIVEKWLGAYSSLDARNLAPFLSKDYKHQMFPGSIHPEETKEEHIKGYGEMTLLITKLEFHVHEATEVAGKVVIHSTAACSAYGTSFTTDSAFILSFVEEDGELKIIQAKQFSDPKIYSDFKGAQVAAKGAPAS